MEFLLGLIAGWLCTFALGVLWVALDKEDEEDPEEGDKYEY